MYKYTLSIFNQIQQQFDRYYFNRLVGQQKVNKSSKFITAYSVFSTLLYAQITDKDSLRDIETCLNGHKDMRNNI